MRLLSGLIALFLFGAVAIDAAPLDPLLARIAAASGVPWRFHVVSRTVSAVEGHLVETRIDAQGERTVTRRCSANVCAGTYAEGRRSALFSYNETPIPQPDPIDAAAATIREIASYAFVDPSFLAGGGRTTDLGVRGVGGDEYAAIAVTVPGATTLIALVDPSSGLLRAVTTGDGTLLVRFGDQRRVDNVTLPFAVQVEDKPSQTYDERRIEPEALLPPAGPAMTFAARPLEIELAPRTGLPRFPCRIENVATICLLDTGASGLAMSLNLADRLHKNPIGEIALEGLGTVLTGVVRAGPLDLGSMRVGPALYAILPDVGSLGADLVVGADVIGRSIVRLDLASRTIAFLPPQSPLEGRPLAMTFDRFTPTIPLELGGLTTRLAIDTGDEASIDLPIAYYRAHPALFSPQGRRAVVGIGGRGFQTIGKIAQVRIGDFIASDVPIGATDTGSPTRARIGAGFLSRFVLELDYARERIALRPVR